jgi:hypothetical protein
MSCPSFRLRDPFSLRIALGVCRPPQVSEPAHAGGSPTSKGFLRALVASAYKAMGPLSEKYDNIWTRDLPERVHSLK